VRTLRFPKGTTHLHKRDFTEAERLVFHEYNRLFPDRASMTDDAIRANLPLLTAMQRIFLMRSFDVFGGIFVPTWFCSLLSCSRSRYGTPRSRCRYSCIRRCWRSLTSMGFSIRHRRGSWTTSPGRN
jgi:hypothetical protein